MLRMLRLLWDPVDWTRLHKTGETLPLVHSWWSGQWHWIWEICVQFLCPHIWKELLCYGLLREGCQPQATGYSVGWCWLHFGNAVGHHNSISSVFSLPCFAAELPHPQGTSLLELKRISRETWYVLFQRHVDKLKSPEESSEVGKNITYEKSLKRMELFSMKKRRLKSLHMLKVASSKKVVYCLLHLL